MVANQRAPITLSTVLVYTKQYGDHLVKLPSNKQARKQGTTCKMISLQPFVIILSNRRLKRHKRFLHVKCRTTSYQDCKRILFSGTL